MSSSISISGSGFQTIVARETQNKKIKARSQSVPVDVLYNDLKVGSPQPRLSPVEETMKLGKSIFDSWMGN